MRSNIDEWFDSIVRFYTRLIGKGGAPGPDYLCRIKHHLIQDRNEI